MRTLVTGAAGFIGSNLVDRLLADGHDVVGIDRFSDYYDPAIKRVNIESAIAHERFRLDALDIAADDLAAALEGVDTVFHLAAQPGVRLSWSDGFARYDRDNVLATQRLLEAVKSSGAARVVYSSSSSIYGNAARYPTEETDLPRPHSPYGVTKLAGEHLCGLYAENWGVSTVSLRYFTVYGPRQRPDMSIHRLIDSALSGKPFPLFGDGTHVREFTYVGDVVDVNVLAARADLEPAALFNVAGGSSTSMKELIAIVEEVTGRSIALDRHPPAAGDVARNGGSTERARTLLGWSPQVSLREGIAAQAAAQAR